MSRSLPVCDEDDDGEEVDDGPKWRLAAARWSGEFLSASNECGSAPHSSSSFSTWADGKLDRVWFLIIEDESRVLAK